MQRQIRQISLLFLDVFLINLAFIIAFLLRFDFNIFSVDVYPYFYMYLNNAIELTIIKVLMFYVIGIYNSLWRYASIDEVIKIIVASLLATTVAFGYLEIFHVGLPKSIYATTCLLDVVFLSASRISYRVIRRVKNNFYRKHSTNTLIYGAGQAGALLIKEFKEHSEINKSIVGFIDDDPHKKGRIINGFKVFGTRSDLKKIIEKKNVEEIIIAIPSAGKTEIKEIVDITRSFDIELSILPSVSEMLTGGITVGDVRKVEIEDLLGRDVVKLDTRELNDFINDRNILVTGGCGSIGSELVRQVSKYGPKEVVLIDVNENDMHHLSLELRRTYPDIKYDFMIASIRERDRLESIFNEKSPEIVFHAAAHKHVPLMERNPSEAVKNNVYGTINVIEASKKYKVKRFVQISTDKAVNPTNVMGTTKRICEMLVQSQQGLSKTDFVAVRFGNVLGSNGSVIPIFKKQIENGGPVTLTHPDIERYFMTIPEAASLVVQAGAMASGGEIFVLDMGEPVKIMDLALNLIKLSGLEPYKDIEVKVTGLRPGEKMYEELLLSEDQTSATKIEKIFTETPIDLEYKVLLNQLKKLEKALNHHDISKIKVLLHEIVPTFKITS